MHKIRLAGVPEHFNAPIKYALQNQLFVTKNIDLDFIEYGEGTGAMCRDLSAGKIDMAIVLTEGVFQHQQTDPSIQIVSQYVDTPLNWGIHVLDDSMISSLGDLEHKRFGISRFGSGSHLMVKVLAKQQHWNIDALQFIQAGGIDALGQAVLDDQADAFLWEVLTTKPHLARYHLRLLSSIQTPWPCFQIAATSFTAQQSGLIDDFCTVLFSVTREFNQNQALAAKAIGQFYALPEADITAWLKTVRWTSQKQAAMPLSRFFS